MAATNSPKSLARSGLAVIDRSGKARRLEEIVALAREDDRKVLAFSYFKQILTDVARFLGPQTTALVPSTVA